jgi:hypothetical protein
MLNTEENQRKNHFSVFSVICVVHLVYSSSNVVEVLQREYGIWVMCGLNPVEGCATDLQSFRLYVLSLQYRCVLLV